MKSFNEWLETRDPEFYSEDWRKALATGALTAASLLPSALQAAEQPRDHRILRMIPSNLSAKAE